MKINPKSDIKLPRFPLPIYNSIHIADAISKEGDEFDIYIGLDKKYAEQLRNFSLDKNDTELQNNTRDRERFGLGSYEEWYKKNRTPFCLVCKRSDALAALVWIGLEFLSAEETDWYTVGWRSYNPFRGKGIMKEFTKFVLDIYTNHITNANLWVALKRENLGSIKLANYLGFENSEKDSDDVSLIMIKKFS